MRSFGIFLLAVACYSSSAFAQSAFAVKYHDGTTGLTVNAVEDTAVIDTTCGSTSIVGWNVDGKPMKGTESSGVPSSDHPEVTVTATQEGDTIIVQMRGSQQMEFVPGPSAPHMSCGAMTTPALGATAGVVQPPPFFPTTDWYNPRSHVSVKISDGHNASLQFACQTISIDQWHADGKPMTGKVFKMVAPGKKPAPETVIITAELSPDHKLTVEAEGERFILSPGEGEELECGANPLDDALF